MKYNKANLTQKITTVSKGLAELVDIFNDIDAGNDNETYTDNDGNEVRLSLEENSLFFGYTVKKRRSFYRDETQTISIILLEIECCLRWRSFFLKSERYRQRELQIRQNRIFFLQTLAQFQFAYHHQANSLQ